MTLVPHFNVNTALWTAFGVAIVFLNVATSVASDRSSSCTLHQLKEVAKNACNHISDKLNSSRDPFQRSKADLGYHLNSSQDRHRRHALHREYHKLNVRFRHGTTGYLDLSYSKPLFEYLETQGNLVDWTVEVLSSKGFVTERNYNQYSVDRKNAAGEQDQEDAMEFVPFRPKRSSNGEDTLDSLRKRRANHALIVNYCCDHIDSAKCSDLPCFI